MCFSALVKRASKEIGAIEVRTDFELHDERTRRDPKVYPPIVERIFPKWFAPVAFAAGDDLFTTPMRYNIHSPFPGAEKLTLYNARRDNIRHSYWAEAFGRTHGLVVVRGFTESVSVAKLLAAGVVSLDEVQAQFQREMDEHRRKREAGGKRWAPTATQQMDPLARTIKIQFRAGQDLLVPALCTERQLADGVDRGFAIVTDEPPGEVQTAGHDRCPVPLTLEAAEAWLDPDGRSPDELIEILGDRATVTFAHKLDDMAP